MSTDKLELVPPDTMNLNDKLKWVKNMFELSSQRCHEAEEYYSKMKAYHKDVAELMSILVSLQKKEKLNEEETEEFMATVDAVQELVTAITDLKDGIFASKEAMDIEDVEKAMLEEEKGKEARVQVEKEGQKFLEKYNQLKAKLGLETQEDVARLTGIDRRYISLIERSKHKPQFKTLKRLADAFGVQVSDFLG